SGARITASAGTVFVAAHVTIAATGERITVTPGEVEARTGVEVLAEGARVNVIGGEPTISADAIVQAQGERLTVTAGEVEAVGLTRYRPGMPLPIRMFLIHSTVPVRSPEEPVSVEHAQSVSAAKR